MTAPRYRTVHRLPASLRHKPGQPPDLGGIGRGHLDPDLARADFRQHLRDHRSRGRRRRQTGDYHITVPHHLRRPLPCDRPVRNLLRHQGRVQIVHHHALPVANKAARQFAADIAQPDKTDFHVMTPR